MRPRTPRSTHRPDTTPYPAPAELAEGEGQERRRPERRLDGHLRPREPDERERSRRRRLLGQRRPEQRLDGELRSREQELLDAGDRPGPGLEPAAGRRARGFPVLRAMLSSAPVLDTVHDQEGGGAAEPRRVGEE